MKINFAPIDMLTPNQPRYGAQLGSYAMVVEHTRKGWIAYYSSPYENPQTVHLEGTHVARKSAEAAVLSAVQEKLSCPKPPLRKNAP